MHSSFSANVGDAHRARADDRARVACACVDDCAVRPSGRSDRARVGGVRRACADARARAIRAREGVSASLATKPPRPPP